MTHNLPEWSLADRLRKIRRDQGLTQQEMADVLGVKPVTLASWESGRTKPSDVVDVAARIEQLFGVPAAWTLGLLAAESNRRFQRRQVNQLSKQHGRRWSDRLVVIA